MESLRFDIELQLEGIKEMLEAGLELTKASRWTSTKSRKLSRRPEMVDTMLMASKESWNTLYEEMQNWYFFTGKACKGDEYDKELNG